MQLEVHRTTNDEKRYVTLPLKRSLLGIISRNLRCPSSLASNRTSYRGTPHMFEESDPSATHVTMEGIQNGERHGRNLACDTV